MQRAGLKNYFSDPRLLMTAWPPRDYAFNEIMKDIGATSFSQLLANKALCKQLVLYHTTPGMRVFTSYWPKWPLAKYIPSGLTALGQKGKLIKVLCRRIVVRAMAWVNASTASSCLLHGFRLRWMTRTMGTRTMTT